MDKQNQDLLPDEALADIYSVFEGKKYRLDAPQSAIQAYFAICERVLEASGIVFKMPQISEPEAYSNYHTLTNTIAKSSQCRTRRVQLETDWWKNDSGPLLSFRMSDGMPVALLPRKNFGGYDYIEPETLKKIRVTEKNITQFLPLAYFFYRTLPNKKLNWRLVLKFSLKRMFSDARRIIFMQLLIGTLGLIVPIATGVIFDSVIPNADINRLTQFALALLVNVFAITLFNIAQVIGVIRFQFRMNIALQSGVWDRLLRLPASFFRSFTAGDLAFRSSAIDRIQQTITSTLMLSIVSGLFSVLTLGLMFYYDALIALGAVALVLIVAVINIFATLIQLKYQRKMLKIQSRLSGLLLQLLTSISKLRVANCEARAFSLWSEKFTLRAKLYMKARNIIIRLGVFQSTFAVIITATLFIMVMGRGEALSFGSFIALNAAFAQFFTAVLSMTGAVSEIIQIVPLYERSKPILDATPEPEYEKTYPAMLQGNIDLKHVIFRYEKDAPLVFKDLTLRINSGEFVAIVGPSGVGKSTILRMLLGFETPESGAIYYDQHDLKSLNIPALRHKVGVVLQNSMLTPGTIFENIAGSRLTTEKDVLEILELVGLRKDIEAMPMKLNTIMTESGKTLSMGQRQRLMIARALLPRPTILFLDEATSAVDNLTQAKIYESLCQLNITRVVIAHRLSTIRNTDKIFVIDHGEVVQTGTYDTLIKEEGLFQRLAQRQML